MKKFSGLVLFVLLSGCAFWGSHTVDNFTVSDNLTVQDNSNLMGNLEVNGTTRVGGTNSRITFQDGSFLDGSSDGYIKIEGADGTDLMLQTDNTISPTLGGGVDILSVSGDVGIKDNLIIDGTVTIKNDSTTGIVFDYGEGKQWFYSDRTNLVSDSPVRLINDNGTTSWECIISAVKAGTCTGAGAEVIATAGATTDLCSICN